MYVCTYILLELKTSMGQLYLNTTIMTPKK